MNMVQQFDPAQVDMSRDLGTPGAHSDVMVNVFIDGMAVSVPEGTSVKPPTTKRKRNWKTEIFKTITRKKKTAN